MIIPIFILGYIFVALIVLFLFGRYVACGALETSDLIPAMIWPIMLPIVVLLIIGEAAIQCFNKLNKK